MNPAGTVGFVGVTWIDSRDAPLIVTIVAPEKAPEWAVMSVRPGAIRCHAARATGLPAGRGRPAETGSIEVPELVELWLRGDLDVDPFLSHRLTLDEVNRGFELMEAQDGIRSVIAFA